MIRYRRDDTAEDDFYLLVAGLDPLQQRSLLRHPEWWERCDCDEYGRPYGALLTVIDWETVHGPQLCQPTREYLP